ncbi:YnbE family lipoprotein [Altererythrobacter sp. GH1-8]|uniref:YnbE family lipoprotein n=1 Tax=Altererythrobacter sp. GH1-8 TaxID=3349333 RepID=UPI00374D7DB7
MNHLNLTALRSAVTPRVPILAEWVWGNMGRRGVTVGAACTLAAVLTGCINIAAPEEPIVIELNVNIRQEVIYRLADDAANTIEENADIF